MAILEKTNTGSYHSGRGNSGRGNSGRGNSGRGNSGHGNSGYYNSGDWNSGDWNSGDCNSGYRNSGNYNSGNYNSGYRNSGNWNSGYWNSGYWNSCDFSNGIFCNKADDNIRIFNQPSGMSMMDFINSKYYGALLSSTFILCEWIDEDATGGYLKTYDYKEACQKWWDEMTDENKEIVKSIPNFDPEIFYDITGIKVV